MKRRKNEMKGNKIGSIFLVSVLALAGIGVAYAGFTDSISVYGTVDTATVEIDYIGWFSGTWVYKIWDFDGTPTTPPGTPDEFDLANEILIYQGFTTQDPIPTEQEVIDWAVANGGQADLVAYSYAEEPVAGEDYDVKMIYDSLFPCIDFSADFVFHYGGSIPAKINVAEIFPIDGDPFPGTDMNFLTWLWDRNAGNPGYGAWVEAYKVQGLDANGAETDVIEDIVEWVVGEPVDVGYQLHFCDYVYVQLTIHLPQMNELQGLSGEFGGNIGVIQWNDMCEEPGEPLIE